MMSITQRGIEKQWPNFRLRCPACGSQKTKGELLCGERHEDDELAMYEVDCHDGHCKDCDARFNFHFEGVIK
jgi:hypothetical protein